MAQKRMFDKAIIDTEKFMDLSMSSKALYFLMGMEADDEGFVSPRKVLRIHGGNEDDIKILIVKKFLIPFDSGVVVITDWNKNNWLDSRRIKPTEYQTERKQIMLTEQGEYSLSNGLAIASPEESSIEESRGEENTSLTPLVRAIPKAKKILSRKSVSEITNPKVSQVIGLFRLVNTNYNAFYTRKAEHTAVETMLKSHTIADIESILKKAVEYNKMTFVTARNRIYSPTELLRNWSECENALSRDKKIGTVLKTDQSSALEDKIKNKTHKA